MYATFISSRFVSISVALILEGEGEITTVTVNSSKRKSLRSTIPMSVVKNMGLKAGDNLSWKYEIRNGEIVTTVRKAKRSNKVIRTSG
jgi:redox-regulated HSP33 family molecular chaperone